MTGPISARLRDYLTRAGHCVCTPDQSCRLCDGTAAEDAELRQATRTERATYWRGLAQWRRRETP